MNADEARSKTGVATLAATRYAQTEGTVERKMPRALIKGKPDEHRTIEAIQKRRHANGIVSLDRSGEVSVPNEAK